MNRTLKSIFESLKNNSRLKTLLTIFFAIVVVLIIAVTAAQKLGNVTINTMTDRVKTYFMNMGSGDGFPYELDAKTVKDIKKGGTGLFMLYDDKTMLLNSTAKEIMPVKHSYSNPAVKVKGGQAIVYDLDSGNFRVQNGSEIKKEYTLNTRIMAAAIGTSGNYAVGTYGEDVQSVLTVYSRSDKKIFVWNFKSERISDISLSDNGKFAAVSTLYSKEGKISSKLYVFNFSSKEYVSCFDYPSTALVRVNYVKGSDIIAVGDNIRSYITDGKNRKNDTAFGADTLHNYAIAEDGTSAVILSKYGSATLSELALYTKNNKEKFRVTFDKGIKWMDTDGKYTAVLFENEIRTYNRRGKQIGSISFAGDPVRVIVDGSSTYVLTSANLQCYDTKGTQKAK